MKLLRQVVLASVILLLAASVVACGSGTTKVPEGAKVTKKQKREILNDAKSDLLIIEKVVVKPELFDQALTGQALNQFIKEYNDDIAAGKVKIRSYQSIGVEFMDLTKGKVKLARVKAGFIDNSRYVRKDNFKVVLTAPHSEKKDFMLHLMKVNGRWKIIAVAAAK